MHASLYTIADQERMAHAKNYFAWQARLALPKLGRRVIEIGCGIGNFTGSLLDRERVLAIDPEPECVARLKERYGERGNLRAMVCAPGSLAFAALADERPDSCVCLNVLEHIEDDAGALRSMAEVLGPGGRIVVLTPAFGCLYGPIDRSLEHWRRYRRRDLARLANVTGLEVETLHYVNAVGFFGWWFNARVWRRGAQSPAQIALFDRCVVPWLSRVEAMVTPPFGQSLFTVLRKP